ncbi:hypothetical protein GQ53DRAFT_752426 [Thozetella sp. PMI_491]|nr:hypothetical protein GQ53DRAFT_752426 [Thozetella sp. PMI_491]
MQLNVLAPRDQNATEYVECGDARWSLALCNLEHADKPIPNFTCVSYTWGPGKVESQFHHGFPVSDRTIPALQAVIRQKPNCTAVWIDAFCIPGPDEPDTRQSTLESMGYIYSLAEEVVVVLSSAAAPALERMNSECPKLLPEHLEALEREEWTSRAWTYQEAVNSKGISLTCDSGDIGLMVDFSTFFSSLGSALTSLGDAAKKQYPRLNALEDLLADCATAAYQERSALQVMAIMDGRVQTRPDDHFYAMIGAITAEPASSSKTTSACEAFMSLCERKGDYSFIYSTAPREQVAGRRWRPVSTGDLPAILSWHSWGSGQLGHYEDDCLYLDNILILRESQLLDSTKIFISDWLSSWRKLHGYSTADLQLLSHDKAAWKALGDMGFRGSQDPITTEHGYFFPSRSFTSTTATLLLIATDVRWTLGAPGFARHVEDENSLSEYIPGIFFGKIRPDMQRESFNVSD